MHRIERASTWIAVIDHCSRSTKKIATPHRVDRLREVVRDNTAVLSRAVAEILDRLGGLGCVPLKKPDGAVRPQVAVHGGPLAPAAATVSQNQSTCGIAVPPRKRLSRAGFRDRKEGSCGRCPS